MRLPFPAHSAAKGNLNEPEPQRSPYPRPRPEEQKLRERGGGPDLRGSTRRRWLGVPPRTLRKPAAGWCFRPGRDPQPPPSNPPRHPSDRLRPEPPMRQPHERRPSRLRVETFATPEQPDRVAVVAGPRNVLTGEPGDALQVQPFAVGDQIAVGIAQRT